MLREKMSRFDFTFGHKISACSIYYQRKHSHLPDIALMNIEALGWGEDDGSVTCCPDDGDSCQVGATSVPDYDEC
jgi:hypothetical protein